MPQDLKDHIIEWDGKDEVGNGCFAVFIYCIKYQW